MRRATTAPEAGNPWGMTAAQMGALQSMVRLGCYKLVARELGVSTRTVQEHITGARLHMHAATRQHAVLLLDRAQRSQHLEAAVQALRNLHDVCARMDLPDQDARPEEDEYLNALSRAERVLKQCTQVEEGEAP